MLLVDGAKNTNKPAKLCQISSGFCKMKTDTLSGLIRISAFNI